jgi:murein DD-endopeptidase MepM/ murein hydrolase activator NlpD
VRPAILVASFLIASLAASQLIGGSAIAGPLFAYHPLPSDAFRHGLSSFEPVVQPEEAVVAAAPDEAAPWTLGPNPAASRAPTITDTTAGDVAAVVRFRPRSGQTGVSRFAAVSVRFTQSMEHRSTERAFTAAVGGKLITGRYAWVKSDTVLVLIPRHPLAYGVRVRLRVTSAARSGDRAALARSAAAAFTVIAQPKTADSSGPVRKKSSGWSWPLIGPITQYFGQHLTQYGFHQGIDIDGDTGDPVVAAHSGRVVVAGYWDECGGLQVHIDHGNGLESWYRHLSASHAHVGQRVSAGALIGRVGATGCALGSHLHFGIRRGTTFVDPLLYLPRRR